VGRERAGSTRAWWRWVPAGTALVVFVVLTVSATRYGWHRDELYFVVAGEHPAWSYPDQPPLTPLLAAMANSIGGLGAVRIVAALLAACLPLLAAASARELNGSKRAQGLAAIVMAAVPITLLSGHLLTTTAVDLAAASTITWLFLRALRTGRDRWFVLVGVVTAVGVTNKLLLPIVPAILVVAIALSGPRRALRRWGLWVGAAIALAASAPLVVWQAAHDWPQAEMANRISGRWDAAEFAFVLVAVAGLLLLPVFVAGLVALLRGTVAPAGRPTGRFLAVAWLLLVVAMLVTRGKAYYTAGLVAALVGAGALAVDGWLSRGRASVRAWGLGSLIAVQAALSVIVALPVLPLDVLGSSPVPAVNGEAAETVGWSELVRQVERVRDDLPANARAGAVVLTANYGEAGALQLLGDFGPSVVFSGHNAFADWGPPPGGAGPVIVVGFRGDDYLDAVMTGCRRVASIDNGYGVDNEEQGAPIHVCDGPVDDWSAVWRRLAHLD